MYKICEGKMFPLMITIGIRVTYGNSNRPEIYFTQNTHAHTITPSCIIEIPLKWSKNYIPTDVVYLKLILLSWKEELLWAVLAKTYWSSDSFISIHPECDIGSSPCFLSALTPSIHLLTEESHCSGKVWFLLWGKKALVADQMQCQADRILCLMEPKDNKTEQGRGWGRAGRHWIATNSRELICAHLLSTRLWSTETGLLKKIQWGQ